MALKQADFKRISDNAWFVGYFNAERKIDVGSIVTLRHSFGKWKVVRIYETEENLGIR
jgi:hypothetical protein